jgi:hypothetical protein
MREVGHADRSVNSRYTHPLEQAHLAASEQTAALARKAGKARKASRPERVPSQVTRGGAGGARTHDRQIMRKPGCPESPLAGGLLTSSRLISRDAAGPARTGQDQPGRDECSHNVLTRILDRGSLTWTN